MESAWVQRQFQSRKRSEEMLQKIKILVAEDDRIMTRLLKDMLGAMGLTNLKMVSNGEDALAHLLLSEVDMIICDWSMYPMDGLTLAKRIRADLDNANRYAPIIMLTGKGERRHVMAARDAGVTEYVIKPFTADTLFKRIQAVVDQPRSFVVSKGFKGPDRRRKRSEPPDGSFKRKADSR